MSFKKALRIADVLILASIRAKRGVKLNKEGKAKKDQRNEKIFLLGLPVVTTLVYLLLWKGKVPVEGITPLLSQSLVFLPAFSLLLMVMNGLMFEISLSSFSTSTDIINWLPIKAKEYVIGSTISAVYFTLPFLMIIYGGSLGAAIYTGVIIKWVLAFTLSLLGLLSGGFAIEIVRAALNGATAFIGKRAGKYSQMAQLLSTVMIIALFSLVFNYQVLIKVMTWFNITVEQGWFVPLLWPSLAVIDILNSEFTRGALYFGGSFIMMAAFFVLGVKARTKYWVPTPLTVSLGPKKLHSNRNGLWSIFGFNPTEQAIINKDFKALFRRREMATLLAIPLMMAILTFINPNASSLWDTSLPTFERLFYFLNFGMALYTLSFYLALVSIGQEGSAFMNLRMSPIASSSIVKAKAFMGFIFSAVILTVILFVVGYVVKPSLQGMMTIILISFVVIVEASLLGMVFGTRYPDFTEVPRAKFISTEATLMGMIGSVIVIFVSIFPFFANRYIYNGSLPLAFSFSFTIIASALTCYLCYRGASSKLRELLTDEK